MAEAMELASIVNLDPVHCYAACNKSYLHQVPLSDRWDLSGLDALVDLNLWLVPMLLRWLVPNLDDCSGFRQAPPLVQRGVVTCLMTP